MDMALLVEMRKINACLNDIFKELVKLNEKAAPVTIVTGPVETKHKEGQL